MFTNQKIFIFGMARSGYETAKYLAKRNNEIIVVDAKPQNLDQVNELKQLGVTVVITEDALDLLDETFDYMIKNPGVKYTQPLVVKAKELQIKVMNEIELASYFFPQNIRIIGVTGSNGKTTVVTLISEMLKQEYTNIHLCGNIGVPIISLVDSIKEGDILIIEISDHQLCDMYDFKTNVSVLTNISETHLDFHDSYERYKKMKKRIFNHHTINDLAIINSNDEESILLTENISSKKLFFGKDCYVKDNKIYYNNEEIISLSDIALKGMHNYENIMASILVVKQFGIKNETIQNVLKQFNGVEHRIEYVTTINERKIYNDAKSTNNQALITALKSFTKPIILIMGGLDRGQSFDELHTEMKLVKNIVCYGETKHKIKEFADKYQYPCTVVDTLIEATHKAYDLSTEGSVILFSPACASWDQYKSFEDRGNEFKEEINKIQKDK